MGRCINVPNETSVNLYLIITSTSNEQLIPATVNNHSTLVDLTVAVNKTLYTSSINLVFFSLLIDNQCSFYFTV